MVVIVFCLLSWRIPLVVIIVLRSAHEAANNYTSGRTRYVNNTLGETKLRFVYTIISGQEEDDDEEQDKDDELVEEQVDEDGGPRRRSWMNWSVRSRRRRMKSLLGLGQVGT